MSALHPVAPARTPKASEASEVKRPSLQTKVGHVALIGGACSIACILSDGSQDARLARSKVRMDTATSPRTSLIGRAIAGRFRITGFIGEGAMATVYRGVQEGEPRDV